MGKIFSVAAAVCAGVLALAGGASAADSQHHDPGRGGRDTALAPTHLTVNDQTVPLAVSGTPEFGWYPQDRAGNESQTAYDIVVRDGLTGAPVWDSGRVVSNRSQAVTYGGTSLTDGDEYTWAVTTWNRQGWASPAAMGTFDLGLSDSDWSGAQWIRRPTTGNDVTIDYTLARREIQLADTASPVTRALVYIAAPMRWQLHANGQVIDTQDDYQMAGENYYGVGNIAPQVRAAAGAGGSESGQLALGVLYADWSVGEAHPWGPQPYPTTLSADATQGATSITVNAASASTCTTSPATSAEFCGASYDWYVGETLGFGTPGTASFTTDTIAAISGDTVTLARPLSGAQPASTEVTSENGPSGLLVKVVIDHADGQSQTVVSDGTWMVTKDTGEDNAVATMRSAQNAGDYVEYYDAPGADELAGWDQAGYRQTSVWQSAVVMGAHPLPNPPDCGDYSEPEGHNVAPGSPATATANPVLSSPCGFTHLQPLQAPVTYKVIHPVSVWTLADGTTVADFGYAFVGVPVVRFPSATSAQAGHEVDLQSSYRLGGTVTTAAASAGATSITVNDSSAYPDFAGTGPGLGFQVGDPITVDAPADGYGAGHPETDTIASISGGVIGLARPLTRDHAADVWVQDAHVGTSPLDTQVTNLSWHYTESGTSDETTGFYVPMGWRYVQITDATAANGGQPLTAQDITAVEQYNAASQVGSDVGDPGEGGGGPDAAANVTGYSDTTSQWDPASVFTSGPGSSVDEAAMFQSQNAELNAVFSLMERSALFAGQQAYEDSPDRQEGQFTGDGTNESKAQMEDLGERALTREFIDNLIYSQQRWWIAGSPAQATTWGEVNAIYQDNNISNGGKRDIPDYTEMFPELVWDYFLASGDIQTLRAAYPTMQNVLRYIDDNIYSTGQASGLVCQLASFSNSSAYQFGIIDWPSTDRYNTVVLNSGVDTVVNERAVLADMTLADAAQALGDASQATSYGQQADALRSAINGKLAESGGLYADGYAVSGSAQDVPGNCSATTGGSLLSNTSQLSQSFAVVDDVAPAADFGRLGRFIASQGMKAGPMDVGQLEMSLVDTNRPAALVTLLTNTAGDGPAKILAEGGTSMWEQWDPGCSAPSGQAGDNTSYDDEECNGSAISQSASDSMSHGWGSVGVYPITRGLLGITPSGIGQDGVTIAPPDAGLTAARGTEWTQHGPVSVAWSRGRGSSGQVTLRVSVPDNMTATVMLPVADRAAGYRAYGAGAPYYEGTRDGRAVYSVGSGKTVFVPTPGGRRGQGAGGGNAPSLRRDLHHTRN